jgi:predicted secreted protein
VPGFFVCSSPVRTATGVRAAKPSGHPVFVNNDKTDTASAQRVAAPYFLVGTTGVSYVRSLRDF